MNGSSMYIEHITAPAGCQAQDDQKPSDALPDAGIRAQADFAG